MWLIWVLLSDLRKSHYKDIFTPIFGKTLQSWRELNNNYDSFTVAIIKNNTIVNLLIGSDYSPEDVALDKLPVGDGKGVLTSCLKNFHKAISPPCVQPKSRKI